MAENQTAYDDELGHETLMLRGHTYSIKELPFKEHDALEKKAARKIPMPDGSQVDGETDNDLMSKLLLSAAIEKVDPPLRGTVTDQGTRVVFALRTAINALHYGAIGKSALETEKEASAAKSANAEEKAKGKG